MAEAKSFSRNKSSPWDLWRRASWRSCNDDDVSSTTRSAGSIGSYPVAEAFFSVFRTADVVAVSSESSSLSPTADITTTTAAAAANDKVQQLQEAVQAAHTEAAAAKRRAEELK